MAGYIGTKASVVSSGAERKKVFAITGATTSLTGLSYTPNQVHVFHNGVRLVDGTDYTATNGTSITLTTAAQNGDEVVVISYATFQVADAYTKAESDDRYVNDPNDVITVSSGNVGIGTSSPVYNLVVSSGGASGIEFGPAYSGTANLVQHYSRSGSAYVNAVNVAAEHIFQISGTERMRIDASGNLLVGMTGTTSSVTYGGVYLRGDNNSGGTNDYAQLFVQYNSAYNHGIVLKELGAGGNAIRFMNNAGTNVGSITTTASSTAYNTSSDYRLKEDWQPMTGASDRVLALKPVNFAWKADGSRVDGFIAHEAQEVVPEAVTGSKDAVKVVDVLDEDGNVIGTEEKPEYQGIDQSKIVPLLTAALQEALTKIEQLEARMAILEGGAA